MKNIHLIPTNKPSRLWINNLLQGKLELSKEVLVGSNTAQNIYITDDSEIKEGDWLIVNDEDVMQIKSSYDNDMTGEDIWVGDSLNGYATYKDNCKKIILTTDLDLIKNGVQSIDDEFLEWLIKNPSCEEIEVEWLGTYTFGVVGYKIIIPSEEPKQLTGLEIAIKLEEIEKEQPKQETIEDAFSKTYFANKISFNSDIGKAFELGAKYQAERMYNDMQEYAEFCIECDRKQMPLLLVQDWYEHYKK